MRKLTSDFELMDVANGFFMVKFDLEEDKAKVMMKADGLIIT
jgi:hypothetical protein